MIIKTATPHSNPNETQPLAENFKPKQYGKSELIEAMMAKSSEILPIVVPARVLTMLTEIICKII
ncbi:transcriptional regulator [Ligilactobacillus ruminis DPC 6832]|uniref:Transcriptional regulator n=1 Tax=Ligilactobacillus ruminis DPC 6832 TaxID=1402208 RepID=A0A837DSH0_9LACO|nr:transcriptional regulator [Ligilactobacillus ruminis DPC 6832]